uniref:Uncharacterized protein n=1 Tax=Peronospora matthiolae TaxID=2874970 RepID=A0AAV1UNF2_9STRA
MSKVKSKQWAEKLQLKAHMGLDQTTEALKRCSRTPEKRCRHRA